jgi:FkbM family methyltransferase
MVDLLSLSASLTNWILRCKGNIIKVNFEVDGRWFEVFVPDDQLFGAVKDVLLNRVYEYLLDFELTNFNGEVIIDAGAHVGLFSLIASVFAKKVISIEPHPVNFNLLKINKIINNVENMVLVGRALWYEKVPLNLYEGNHTGSSSITQTKDNVESYLVRAVTLEEIIDRFGEIGLLKMDIEGGEFEVFNNVRKNVLDGIKCMSIEVHTRAGDLNQIIRILSSRHFEVKFFYPPIAKDPSESTYQIKIKDLFSVKAWRKLVYGLCSLAGVKDKSAVILFAKRKASP